MLEWWNSLSFLGQIFAVIAVPATIIMLIQSVLLLLGIGFGDDVDFDSGDLDDSMDINGGDGLSLFTIRGLVAFFSVGGWAGLALESSDAHMAVSIIVAFAAGAVAFVGVAMMFKWSMKLQDQGNLEIINAVGKQGKVYIPVPPAGEGLGKVTVMVQSKLCELDAAAVSGTGFKTGEIITVKAILDEQTVLVEKLSAENNSSESVNKELSWKN